MLARLADPIALLGIALLLALELNGVYSCSITADETAEIGAGVNDVFHGECTFFAGHPPLAGLMIGGTLTALGVRPRSAEGLLEAAQGNFLLQMAYGERVVFDDNPDFRFPFARPGVDSVVTAARMPLLVFPVLLATFAYVWAKSRFGPGGGLLALGLVLTYPDLLGHGALAMTDVPFSALALLAGYALDRAGEKRSRAFVVLLGVATGLACGVKLWGLFLVPALAAVAGPKRWRELLAAGAVAALVLWAVYLGSNPFVRYVLGVVAVRDHHAEAHDAVLLGHATHAPWYLLVAGLLKLPLGTIALLGTALVLARREWRSAFHLPAGVIFLANSFLAEPYGTRYLLPVVSFLVVSAGRLVPWATTRPRQVFLALALATNALAVVCVHPWYVSAVNPLAGTPWRALDNANTDLGQGLKALADWQRAHGSPPLVVVPRGATPFVRPTGYADYAGVSYDPRMAALEAYGVKGRVDPTELGEAVFHPKPGLVYAISVHVLARAHIFETDEPLIWPSGVRGPAHMDLGVKTLPVATVGGVFLIFDLRPQTLGH